MYLIREDDKFFPTDDTSTATHYPPDTNTRAQAGAGPTLPQLIFVFGLVHLSAACSYQPFPRLVGLSITLPPRGKEAH